MSNKINYNDSKINEISESIELPDIVKTNDIYLDLLEVIISQQLSGKVAKVIFTRFLELFKDNYPLPVSLVETDDSILRNAGLSGAKTRYVKNLAEFSLKNDISVKHIDSMSDEDIIEYLTQVKGTGKWSVEMLLIFSLNRPNVFPYDDLVIKKSMVDTYGIKKEGKELIRKMVLISKKWEPNRSLASRYLWANYGLKKVNEKTAKRN
jgi:DNA-3-methyladenine glycosylase II